jgi:hypothetical protein
MESMWNMWGSVKGSFEQAPPLCAVACRDITEQHITTFPDADKRAFLLSVLCLNPHCLLDTITTIFQMATGQQLSGHPRASVCYNTVRTPTLCKPDMSDRPYYFLSTYLI